MITRISISSQWFRSAERVIRRPLSNILAQHNGFHCGLHHFTRKEAFFVVFDSIIDTAVIYTKLSDRRLASREGFMWKIVTRWKHFLAFIFWLIRWKFIIEVFVNCTAFGMALHCSALWVVEGMSLLWWPFIETWSDDRSSCSSNHRWLQLQAACNLHSWPTFDNRRNAYWIPRTRQLQTVHSKQTRKIRTENVQDYWSRNCFASTVYFVHW